MDKFRSRTSLETQYQLKEVLSVLDIGNKAFAEGKSEAWMIISAYLHQLLTDTSRHNEPLAKRVFVEVLLHPLRYNYANTSRGLPITYLLATPGWSFPPSPSNLFNLALPAIPLSQWLNQVITISQGEPSSIKDFLLFPRHQAGGVHFDREVSSEMQRIESVFTIFFETRQIPIFCYYVAEVGKYVHSQLYSNFIAGLGNQYYLRKNYEKAEEFIKAAVAVKHEMGDLLEEIYLLTQLHNLYTETECHDDALEASNQILALEKLLNDRVNL